MDPKYDVQKFLRAKDLAEKFKKQIGEKLIKSVQDKASLYSKD